MTNVSVFLRLRGNIADFKESKLSEFTTNELIIKDQLQEEKGSSRTQMLGKMMNKGIGKLLFRK